MEIIRVDSDIERSLIAGRKLTELPGCLAEMFLRFLHKTPGIKRIIVGDKVGDALFELVHCYTTIDSLPPEVQFEFTECMNVYWWWVKPHVTGRLSSPVCVECHQELQSSCPIVCSNPKCLSHDLWWQIIGPSYPHPSQKAEAFI